MSFDQFRFSHIRPWPFYFYPLEPPLVKVFHFNFNHFHRFMIFKRFLVTIVLTGFLGVTRSDDLPLAEVCRRLNAENGAGGVGVGDGGKEAGAPSSPPPPLPAPPDLT